MPTMRIHARPTPSFISPSIFMWFVMLPFISLTSKPTTTTKHGHSQWDRGQIFNPFVMVVSVTVWIAWQLNCNMPKVDVENEEETKSNKPKGVCSHLLLSTLILHIINIVNQIDCGDSLVLTPTSIDLVQHGKTVSWEKKKHQHRHNHNNNNKKNIHELFESMPNKIH